MCRGMRRSGMLDNERVSVMPHAMIARASSLSVRLKPSMNCVLLRTEPLYKQLLVASTW
jgi:hypothetical protein